MLALLPQRRAFVDALLTQGDNNHTKAAITAGYSETNARWTGHRLAHDEKVLLAIKEEAERRINSSVIMAASNLVMIADGTIKAPIGTQLKAIDMVLNRGGMPQVNKSEIMHTHKIMTPEARRERINQLASAMGKQLSLPGVGVIDATFTEVVVDEGRDGLEDLL